MENNLTIAETSWVSGTKEVTLDVREFFGTR